MNLDKVNGIQEALFGTVKMMFDEYSRSLNFDKTAVYTIYDDSEKDKGRYSVGENKDMTFIACSPNQNYKKGDKVYVTIPQGDTSRVKFIVSTYLDPVSGLGLDYRSPHTAIAPVKELESEYMGYLSEPLSSAEPGRVTKFFAKGLYPSPTVDGVSTNNIIPNFTRIENDFSRLYVGVEFNNSFDVDDFPNYGLNVVVVTSQLEVTRENTVQNEYSDVSMSSSPANLRESLNAELFMTHEFDFSVEQMIGNLYMNGSSWQETLIDISRLKNIVAVYFYLYLDSNGKKSSIDIKNIKFSFGKDQQEMPDNLLNLYSVNDLGYQDGISQQKTVYLRRGLLDKNSGLYYISSSPFYGTGKKFLYGKANSADRETSDALGPGWDLIESTSGNLLTNTIDIESINPIEEFKVVEIDEETNAVISHSNSIVFFNNQTHESDRPIGTLYLKPVDGIYEHKNYDLEGKLINLKDYEKFHQIQVSTVNKDNELKQPVAIHWYYPREKSMIQDISYWNNLSGGYTKLNERYLQNLEEGDYSFFTEVPLYNGGEKKYDVLIINNPKKVNYLGGYAIDYYYNPLYLNNEIVCRYYYDKDKKIFDEGRISPQFSYTEEPQDDFEVILSFGNNERPFITYNPYGYTYASNKAITTKFLPTMLNWSVYSKYYRNLTENEMKTLGKSKKAGDLYEIQIDNCCIQDKDHNAFDLVPNEYYSNFYIFLSPSAQTNIDVGEKITDTNRIVQACVLVFEFTITDLSTNTKYKKIKKISVPIKRESGSDMYMSLKEQISYSDKSYNYWYLEDCQMGLLSKNSPAGLKCTSVFNYNQKGSVESYNAATLEAFGQFTTITEYVIPSTDLSNNNNGYSVYMRNAEYLNTYNKRRDVKTDNNNPEIDKISKLYVGRSKSLNKDSYYWSYDYKNNQQLSPGYAKALCLDIDQDGKEAKLFYIGHENGVYYSSIKQENLYQSNENTVFTLRQPNQTSDPWGSDPINDVWQIARSANGTIAPCESSLVPLYSSTDSYPNSLMVYSNNPAGFYMLVYKEGKTVDLIGTDWYTEEGKTWDSNKNKVTLHFYEVQELNGTTTSVYLTNNTLRPIPQKSNDALVGSYIYKDRKWLYVDKLDEKDRNQSYYCMQAALAESNEVLWEITSSSGKSSLDNNLPANAPTIEDRAGGVGQYLRPSAIYSPSEEVYYISVWGATKKVGENGKAKLVKSTLIWQQPIIIYGPDETPTNMREGEAIGLAVVDSDGSAAGSISLGQQTSDLIQQLNAASEATYGLVTSDAQAPVFMLTEQGDVVMDLTHDSSNKIKQEIAIRPDNLKIKQGENLLTLEEYIKNVVGITS